MDPTTGHSSGFDKGGDGSQISKEEAINQAKQIPKGLTVANEAGLRAAILNQMVGLLMTGQLARGPQIREWS